MFMRDMELDEAQLSWLVALNQLGDQVAQLTPDQRMELAGRLGL